MIYRVILKVGYYSAYFEFKSSKDACDFASAALGHMVSNEDTDKASFISMQVVDVEAEKKESEED